MGGSRLIIAVVAVVFISLVAGLWIVGSPANARRERMDANRVSDLRGIMRATDDFWEQNSRLPASLTELASDARVDVAAVDPTTSEPYGYRTLTDETYELCAVFEAESDVAEARVAPGFWAHEVGRICFEIMVDQGGRSP